jgi:hypothetical protein
MEVYRSDQIVELLLCATDFTSDKDASWRINPCPYRMVCCIMQLHAITIALERTGNRMYMLCVCLIAHVMHAKFSYIHLHTWNTSESKRYSSLFVFYPIISPISLEWWENLQGNGIVFTIWNIFTVFLQMFQGKTWGIRSPWNLVGGLEHDFFSIQLGSSSSQLTNSYF